MAIPSATLLNRYTYKPGWWAGIKINVVNAASIAIASNDKVKTDLRDSKKIAEQLSTQQLKCIHIPSETEVARRALTRG